MKRSITRWITTLSTAAALAVPAMTLAQTPEQQTPPQQTPPQQAPPQQTPPQPAPPQHTPPQQTQPTEQPSASQPAADQAVAPQEHLKQAKAALVKIQTTSLTSHGRTQLSELKRHLTALERGSASTPKTTPRSTPSWGAEVAAMDKILSELLGPGSTTGMTGTTGTTGVAGSAGTTRSTAGTAVPLDEATRAALMEVRSHLVAYATSMSGAAPPKGDAAMPSADTPSAAAPSAATPSAAMPSKDEPSTPASSTPSPASAQARQQVDQEAARRHLMAARDTLNQLTQLPAAAQLTGEARTQVTQLIGNFNELITTQTQWRASYGKTAANLNALLGPDTEAAPAVAPTPTETPAVPGAVGTSGVSSADLDPAVRAKLVELRRNLAEFQKAMGGPAASDK